MKDSKYTLPIEKETIKITEPLDTAVGPSAVKNSFASGFSQMDWFKCSKAFFKLNQVEGFDCPSCAWPDPKAGDRSSIAEYCENGAKAVAEEGTSERVTPAFFAKYSVAEMNTWSERKLGKSGRITHPMILREGATHYEPISWKDAFQFIGDKLKSLDSPDEAVFYTSGRTGNEAAFMYQLFARQYGTNNLPDCSNMCHETTGKGLSDTIGIGKGTVVLEDLYVADLILIIGQNPGTNHPRMLTALQKTKRNGGKIIAINPLEETAFKKFKNPQEVRGWVGKGTNISDLFLPVRINGDLALLKGIMCILLEMEEAAPKTIFDHEFIEKYTEGYEDLIANLKKQNLQQLSAESGISQEEMRQAAEMIRDGKRMIICWAMGITQHENGVANVQEIVNLLLLRGSIGKPGAGACPVRGHSNVQGDRTMGVWEKIRPGLKSRMEATFDFKIPEKEGYNSVTGIQAMHNEKVKVFFSMGGNLLLAGPDTEYTAKGMRNCDLTVMVSTKPNRNHLVTGKTAIILPCLGRTEVDMQAAGEQFVSAEDSMGIVHKSKGVLPPASKDLMSEPRIVAELAKATLGNNTKVEWEKMAQNYDLIRDRIEDCVAGFNNFNERVRHEGGFHLINSARERNFATNTGKAKFTANKLTTIKLKEGEFLMTTMRSHDQFNTTIYGNEDRYRGIANARRVVMMNAADLKKHGLKEKEVVDLVSHYKGVERIAPHFIIVEYKIPRGNIATYFPEANVLVPINQHSITDTPASKSVVVTIRKNQV